MYTVFFVLDGIDRIVTYSIEAETPPTKNTVFEYLPEEFGYSDVIEWFVFEGKIVAHG